MAHAATLNGLAGSLVSAITGKTPNEASFPALRDQTLKGLRNQSHARTNQFAVKSKLDGMVEKFEVLNREDLATALQSRRDELPSKSKYLPEILSFLLELSDRPAEKTMLEDVERANGSIVAEKDLTWEDILAEDPLSDSEVWEDVERGDFSSGDDSLEEDSNPTVSTQATSWDGEDVAAAARLHLIQCDDTLLSAVKDTRHSWELTQSRENGHVLSELIVIREILSMMRGFPTDLFHMDATSGRVSLARRATIATASSQSLYDVLNTCVRDGTIINYLRRWIASPQDTPYLQSIQSCMEKLCMQFGQHLGPMEQRYISSPLNGPSQPKTVVSAIQVQTEVHQAAELLIRQATLIRNASGDKSPFALLDLLYDEVMMSQLTDTAETFQSLSTIFLAGLKTYLRPVAAWIKTGSLAIKDDGTFFIRDSDHNCELGEFWHSHFTLRHSPDGAPSAPKCLQPFTPKIFALGKSRALMKRLNQDRDDFPDDAASIPSFNQIMTTLRQNTLMSFSAILHDTLDVWIEKISTDCAPQLQHSLLHHHGLLKILTALPYVYFSRDGIAFSAFADALIARVPKIDSNVNAWSDHFLLTEVAHNIFGDIPGFDADDVYVSTISADAQQTTLVLDNSTVVRKLAELEIQYLIPWPVQNIIRSKTLVLHNKVFVFLLQIYYSSKIIQDRFWDLRSAETTNDGGGGGGGICKTTLKLRQHLLYFTSLMQTYLTNTANTLHQDLQTRILKAENLDNMALIWSEYEHRLEIVLLLTQKLGPVREAILRILELSELLVRRVNSGGESLAGLMELYSRDMAFLLAGVRGVGRAGGESSLEVLAERLESFVG